MTYEQALEIKQNLTPEQVRNDLERYLLRGEAPIIKGVAMAMQALEKQIPKKPLWGGTSNASWRSCPVCHSRENKTHKYCSQCGQALDWSDTNG